MDSPSETPSPSELVVPAGATDVQSATQRYLLYGLLPAWFFPGVLDWVMHRRTDIGPRAGRWRLQWRQPRLLRRYVAGILGSITVLIGLPYGEELLRCPRAGRPDRTQRTLRAIR